MLTDFYNFIERPEFQEAEHAVHGMLWAPAVARTLVLDRYPSRALVLMQMRFDGALGFPGGMVDERVHGLPRAEALDLVLEALERELLEETMISVKVPKSSYVGSEARKQDGNVLICHFFHIEVAEETFYKAELEALKAKDFGDEVMGHVRVPLYTMEDGRKGLPIFLKNQFAGNAREQLMSGLLHAGIMGRGELEEALGEKATFLERFDPNPEPSTLNSLS